MKNKKKKVAVHAELRKESIAFDGWLKYEVTIKNSEGKLEKVPAYGKDLQDALRRVVHDDKVKSIEKRVINKVPTTGWALAWFLGLCLLVILGLEITDNKHKGYWILATIVTYAFMTLSISNWFTLRNRKKND